MPGYVPVPKTLVFHPSEDNYKLNNLEISDLNEEQDEENSPLLSQPTPVQYTRTCQRDSEKAAYKNKTLQGEVLRENTQT